jgi:predicted Zn-dependent peptidase
MKRIEHASALLKESCTAIMHRSGLRILVTRKPLRGAYAFFGVRYGSMDRSYRNAAGEWVPLPDGTAHFMEHKLFDETPEGDPGERLSALGAEFNAYTSYEKTVYYINATERFGEALEELLRFVTHPCFTEASVKKEQGIIAEEIRMYADNPWERCYQNMLSCLYHKNAVRREILGSASSIARITPTMLQECYGYYYNLSNMALTVCGDVTPEEVVAVCDRVLPEEREEFVPPERREDEPQDVCERERRVAMQVAKPIFYVGIKDTQIPSDPEERLRRDAVMSLLDEVLFSGAGRFYGALLEEGLITPSFSAGYSISPRFAFHCIGGESDDPGEVLRRIRAYMESVLENGIDEEDFVRCRRVLYAEEIRGYDSAEEIATELMFSAFSETALFVYPHILQSLTCKDLQEALAELLREDKFVLSVAEPSEDPQN